MGSIAIAPKERKDLICLMKRENKPSCRLRMHIVLLACDGRSPTEISRTLFCSRTTVYSIVGRFMREGRAAFEDRKRRGLGLTPVGGHIRVSDVNVEEGSPK